MRIRTDTDIESALHARGRQRALIEGRGPRVSEFLLNPHRFGGGTVAPNKLALLHFEGTNGGTVFTDQVGSTWTAAGGGATTSTSQFQFGTSSLSLNGSSRITTPVANIPFGTGEMTLACWIRPTGVTTLQNIFNNRGASAGLTFRLTTTGKLEFFHGGGTNQTLSTNSVSAATWTHVALTRSNIAGSFVRLFINGNLEATSVNIGTGTDFSSGGVHTVATIGCFGQANVEFFNGFIDEYLCASSCYWTASFTPPAAPWS